MSEFFRDWNDAHAHAQAKADRLGLDVAIRATKEFGRKGFSVHLASRNDSDYALAEIVKPAVGKEWKRNPSDPFRAWLREVAKYGRFSVRTLEKPALLAELRSVHASNGSIERGIVVATAFQQKKRNPAKSWVKQGSLWVKAPFSILYAGSGFYRGSGYNVVRWHGAVGSSTYEDVGQAATLAAAKKMAEEEPQPNPGVARLRR